MPARGLRRQCGHVALALLALVGCGPVLDEGVERGGPAPLVVDAPIAWPAEGARLTPPPVVVPEVLRGVVVAVDAGHGAPGNTGARSARCEDEQDLVLPIAEQVADVLDAGGLTVLRLRPPGERPTYDARLRALADSAAVLMVSVHADVRLPASAWSPTPGCEALVSHGQPGFSTLWSDEDPTLAPGRRALADALAARLRQTGLPAYDGQDYTGIYEQTGPGVFVDRHRPARRVRFLRRPAVPSAIVEVAHLLDPDASLRIREPAVKAALAHAIAGGIVDALMEDRAVLPTDGAAPAGRR